MVKYVPERIYIDTSVADRALTRRVLAKFSSVPHSVVDDVKALLNPPAGEKDPLTAGKRRLLITQHKGKFVKPFRWSANCLGYNYFVINLASNCHYECTYCILQSYLNNPMMVLYANTDNLLNEIRAMLASHPDQFHRMGTGELADSLALDDITGYSRELVPFFAEQARAVLEFKTKSACIENLRDLDPKGRVIVSWSLNSEAMIEREEYKTASLEDRLRAAAACQSWGYPVGFHFDPLIWYEGWPAGYEAAVRRLFEVVDARRIVWISLGALRFPAQQKQVIRRRFPRSTLLDGELILAPDAKLRYFKPLRVQMYKQLSQWIRTYGAEGIPVYLCMEAQDVWTKTFNWTPHGNDAVTGLLDSRINPPSGQGANYV